VRPVVTTSILLSLQNIDINQHLHLLRDLVQQLIVLGTIRKEKKEVQVNDSWKQQATKGVLCLLVSQNLVDLQKTMNPDI